MVWLRHAQTSTWSRKIAVIYYLTHKWKETYGGCLVDHGLTPPAATNGKGKAKGAAGNVIVPEWNSVVAFDVPRWHEVTPCSTNRCRYSIFGWFL